MNTSKSLAQVRGDVLADIEAIRMKKMDATTGMTIFEGYKVINSTINTEIALFRAAVKAKETGLDFANIVRLGQRVVNEEEPPTSLAAAIAAR